VEKRGAKGCELGEKGKELTERVKKENKGMVGVTIEEKDKDERGGQKERTCGEGVEGKRVRLHKFRGRKMRGRYRWCRYKVQIERFG